MKRVLLVEDESSYRELLAEQIRENGIQVLEATNGLEALNTLKTNDADLILLDLLMPVMDGQTFLDRLNKTSKRDTPVIILSNLSQAEVPQGIPYLMKADVNLEDLLNLVKKKIYSPGTLPD